MSSRKAIYPFILVLLLAATVPAPAQAADDGPAGRFESAPCTFKGADQFAEDAIRCGYLIVPERHSAPEGRSIRLAVAVLKRSAAADGALGATSTPAPAGEGTAAPSPLVLAQGGPGGSTLDAFIPALQSGALSSLLKDRDVVLFDQRGTLYSEPALLCTESFTLSEQTIEQHLTRSEDIQLSLEALRKCRDRLARSGVDLAAYNSLENAADIEALRTALGYPQINLYGVSYGTLLALHTMALYPGGLRSVILDGVLPPQINFLTQAPQAHGRSFAKLFGACAADPACQAAYPDLEQVTFDLVDRFNAVPARVPIIDRETGKTYNAVLDGDAFLDLLIQFFYVTPLIPLIPAVVDGARDGNFAVIQRAWPLLAFDRTQAEGMYLSTVCAEDADFFLTDVDLSGLPSQLASQERDSAEAIVQACRDWNVPELGPAVDAPVGSSVPVLLFNGEYDPITPPAYGETAAQSLPNSSLYTFPGLGHGALPDDPCAQEIARAFLDNPTARPETSCLTGGAPVAFAAPSNTLMTPALGRLLEAIDLGNFRPFLLLALALGSLFTIFILWPFAWFIGRMQRAVPERRLAARLAPWLAIAVALLGAVFFAALVALAFDVSLQGSDLILLIGAPMRWAWLFALPPAMALLVAGMLALAILAWRRQFWGVGRRLYYSFLTAAALGVAAWLVEAGLMFPLLTRAW